MNITFTDCPRHGRVKARRHSEPAYRMMGGRRVEWGTTTVIEKFGRTNLVKCETCNHPGEAIVLNVTVTDTPCNETCVSATGKRCECSCGGENHGA